jgi:glycosyltransferase involved in cell wall biosynthesis
MMRPPVTALLPIKNGEIWIPRIAESLEKCLKINDQLVIVDDHSTDDSWTVLSKLHFDFEFILCSNPGQGLVSALNFGIKMARHEWIARFDVDDEYPEIRLEAQLSSFAKSTVAIFGDYSIVDSLGNNLGLIPSPVFSGATALSLVHSDRTAHPSVVFRKKAAIDVGLYREEDFPSEDLSLWIRLAKVGELITVPENVLTYTLHQKSISTSRYSEAKNRSQELIQYLFMISELVPTIERDFDSYMKSYRKMKFSEERKILFLRDLLVRGVFSKLSFRFRAKVIAYLILCFFNPTTFISVSKLFIARRKRARVRFS